MDNDESSTSSAEATGTSVSSGSPAPSPKPSPRLGASVATMATLPPPLTVATSSMMSLEKSHADLDAWLEKLTQGTPLTEPEVKSLTDLARERFLQESNVQPVPAPVTICGDIHVRTGLPRGAYSVACFEFRIGFSHGCMCYAFFQFFCRDNGTISWSSSGSEEVLRTPTCASVAITSTGAFSASSP
jgi:hypothetical protein